MSTAGIHPSKRETIAAECEQARQRARTEVLERLHQGAAHWAQFAPQAVALSTEAYAKEHGRLCLLMISAIEDDGAEGRA